jgi:hypothetical protein
VYLVTVPVVFSISWLNAELTHAACLAKDFLSPQFLLRPRERPRLTRRKQLAKR